MRYEVIREIFNLCSGNQMRDVFVTTEDVEDPEEYVKNRLEGTIDRFDKEKTADGWIINVTVDGLRQRFSFSED